MWTIEQLWRAADDLLHETKGELDEGDEIQARDLQTLRESHVALGELLATLRKQLD